MTNDSMNANHDLYRASKIIRVLNTSGDSKLINLLHKNVLFHSRCFSEFAFVVALQQFSITGRSRYKKLQQEQLASFCNQIVPILIF